MKHYRLRIARFGSGTWGEDPARRRTGALDEDCLMARAEAFAWRVIRLAELLPMTGAAGLCGDELLMSAGLMRSHCQDSCAGTADEDVRGKLELVAEDARECQAWLELLVEAGVVEQSELEELMEEVDELVGVVAESLRSARGNNRAQAGLRDCEGPYLRLRR